MKDARWPMARSHAEDLVQRLQIMPQAFVEALVLNPSPGIGRTRKLVRRLARAAGLRVRVEILPGPTLRVWRLA